MNNTYICTVEVIDGANHFFVEFTDINSNTHIIEVKKSVYEEFQSFKKIDKRQQHHTERHIEHMPLSEEEVHKRATSTDESVEEKIIRELQHEELRQAINNLPDIQKRRLLLYFERDLTLEKIARIEGCSVMSIKRSIDRAKEKISKNLKRK